MRLKQYRNNLKLSQQEVANIIGVSQKTYCNYESGVTEPSSEILVKLADLFHTSLDSLIREKSYRYTESQQEAIALIETLSDTDCAKVVGFIAGLKK